MIELKSESDRLKSLQEKMQEYLENGLRLGWLINPRGRQVEIYRPHLPVEVVKIPALLSGEEVLPGFELQSNSQFAFPNTDQSLAARLRGR